MSIPKLVASSCCDMAGVMAHPSPTAMGGQARSPATLWLRLPPQNPGGRVRLILQMVVVLQLSARSLWPPLTVGLAAIRLQP